MDLVITAASVLASADGAAHSSFGTAGVAVTAGEYGYLDPTTNTYKLAGAQVAGIAAANIVVFLNNAGAGQPVKVCSLDAALTHGAAGVNINDPIYLSVNPGMITKTIADVQVTGAFMILVGIAVSATVMKFDPLSSGVAHP